MATTWRIPGLGSTQDFEKVREFFARMGKPYPSHQLGEKEKKGGATARKVSVIPSRPVFLS